MSIIHAIRTAVTIGMIVTLTIHPTFIATRGFADGLASKAEVVSGSCVACKCCQPKSPEFICCCCKAQKTPTDNISSGDAEPAVWVEVDPSESAGECDCGTMLPPFHDGQERSEQEVRHSSSRKPDRSEFSVNAAVPFPLQAVMAWPHSFIPHFSQCFLCRWLI